MEYILVLLIVALLNGAIAYIDGLMEGIIPLTLYAEQYMSTLAGVDLFQSLFDIVFGFGVSLIVLKFLKKGFETYVLWSDGDADEEPIAILTNFFKAMAVAICFPTMYDWLATIVEEMSNKMLEAIGLATAYDWAGWVSGISTMGLVTAIFGLVFVIVYFILYFQFLMRGLEILILRVGIPLACVGLIDNDKGMFKDDLFFRCRCPLFQLNLLEQLDCHDIVSKTRFTVPYPVLPHSPIQGCPAGTSHVLQTAVGSESQRTVWKAGQTFWCCSGCL